MSPGRGEDDSAAAGMRIGGEITGRVHVGRFVLEVGSPAGIRADFTAGQATESHALRVALSQPAPASALAGAEEAIDDAESVTGRVERALELFTALAQGKIRDRRVFLKEVDVLLAALERLDREGRHRDTLRLARALAALLALATRWIALVESLRLALRAARTLGDAPAIAWARHELGTLLLAADDAAAATSELRESLRIREEISDKEGAELTQHNLTALSQAFGPSGRDGTGPRPALVAAIIAGVLLVAAGGVAVTVTVLGDDDEAPADTTAPKVSITHTPGNPTEERSASFEFEADEEVQRFECQLDDGFFEQCVSPKNVVGPLAVGEHVFAARAVDFASNRGDSATYRWTIEAGEGPAAVIHGPAVTNQTEATFTIEAPGATRLECSLDDEDAEACDMRAVFKVDEGKHTLVVRAFADDRPGPPAEHRWTVDTTPPEVKIDAVTFTSERTVEIAFTANESEVRVECALLEPTVAPQGQLEPEPKLRDTQKDCTDPATFTDLASGTLYRVRVTATDAAGNVGIPAEEDFATDSEIE